MTSKSRSDKGKTRKVSPEELLEAINQVRPMFRDGYTKSCIYRMCIQKGILRKEQIAPTTFYRFIREYDLLNDNIESNKRRLAFAMEHANDLWQGRLHFTTHACKRRGIKRQNRAVLQGI